MYYDSEFCLLIDFIGFWQLYKETKTQMGGWQSIEIWGVEISIEGGPKQFVVEGGPKIPLHTMNWIIKWNISVVTIAGFAGKSAIFLFLLEKLEDNIIFHCEMLENWNFWVF